MSGDPNDPNTKEEKRSCYRHGPTKAVASVSIDGGRIIRHYCMECIVELLDKMRVREAEVMRER